MAERVVLVGYGMVGARFVEELLPSVRAGLVQLTVVGAEAAEAYNRVLLAEYAVGATERESLELTDSDEAREAGVRILTGTSVVEVRRSRRTVLLGDGEELPYDRLVLATGARAQVPTLEGIVRVRRDALRPPESAEELDSAGAPLPDGIMVMRDLTDAERLGQSVRAGARIVVLGAGVLGMELALAAVGAGAEVCVVYHDAGPMERNLDRGGAAVLARSARASGVAMVPHARAESIVFHEDEHGVRHFEALVCADGKQIAGDILVVSCGVAARVELAGIAGLPVARGVLVDEELRSWADPDIYAIGDCAHVEPKPEGWGNASSSALPAGGPLGLIGAGWRQAEWLAARIEAELRTSVGSGLVDTPPLPPEHSAVVMLKAEKVDVVAVGNVHVDPWDEPDHAPGCSDAALSVAQWADPANGRYVSMVTRNGVLDAFVCVGMPRTAAELTLLFERGSELPADRSVLLRYDGPDYAVGLGCEEAFAPTSTVCWCNGVTAGQITDAVLAGCDTVARVGRETRAGSGCGGCKGRIGEILERNAPANAPL
ncbi:MAG TPA: FAD-dependent oxidoreductase [Pseudolysinimonas sp.]|nr:FAD-dependent oxidoreductase [Pseudolysinimonas sp.]